MWGISRKTALSATTPYVRRSRRTRGGTNGAKGSAGVGPQAGPIVGLRYEIRIGGPAYFSAHAGHAFSKRDVIDPLNPPATRRLGEKDVSLLLLDAGITLNLTGQKSWHGIVPFTRFGVGVAANVGSRADPGNFEIGPLCTRLALGSLRGGRWRFASTSATYSPATYPGRTRDSARRRAPVTADRTRWAHTAFPRWIVVHHLS